MQLEAPNWGKGFLKTVLPIEMLFTLGVALAKGSVLLLYRRIFSLDRSISLWVNIAAVIVRKNLPAKPPQYGWYC
jgi:hypothetical protein